MAEQRTTRKADKDDAERQDDESEDSAEKRDGGRSAVRRGEPDSAAGKDDEESAGGKKEEKSRSGRRRAADGITARDAAEAALRAIVDLTGKRPEGVTAVQPSEDGWLVGVEVVEDRRVPSSSDILAIYEAELSPDGDLMSYRRGPRYARGRGDNGEGRR